MTDASRKLPSATTAAANAAGSSAGWVSPIPFSSRKARMLASSVLTIGTPARRYSKSLLGSAISWLGYDSRGISATSTPFK